MIINKGIIVFIPYIVYFKYIISQKRLKKSVGMINIDNFVKSKQIKFIYKIINSEMDSWNAIGKHWLQKYDKKFGVDFFLCKLYRLF
jgi:hypothetical protein